VVLNIEIAKEYISKVRNQITRTFIVVVYIRFLSPLGEMKVIMWDVP